MAALLPGMALEAPAAQLHLVPAAATCVVVLAAALLLWTGVRSRGISFVPPSQHGLFRFRPTGAAATGGASGAQLRHFFAVCLAMGAVLHAEPLMAAAVELRLRSGVVLAVALFNWEILSLNFHVILRRPNGEPRTRRLQLHRSTTAAASAPVGVGPAPRTPLLPSVALCVATGALVHAELLLQAADLLRLHRGVAIGAVLTVAALFNWAVHSLFRFVARRQAEGRPGALFRPATTSTKAASAPTGSAPRSLLARPFVALCAAVGAAMHADALMDAAVKLPLHPDVLSCIVLAVAVVFHLSVVSLSILMPRHPAERQFQAKMPLRPTDPMGSAFLVLAVLMSASFFIEPIAASAAELGLPSAVVAVTVVLFTALFNIWIGIFRSFFLARSRPSTAAVLWNWVGLITAAPRWEWVAAVTAAGIGVGIASCLAAPGGLAPVYAPARR